MTINIELNPEIEIDFETGEMLIHEMDIGEYESDRLKISDIFLRSLSMYDMGDSGVYNFDHDFNIEELVKTRDLLTDLIEVLNKAQTKKQS